MTLRRTFDQFDSDRSGALTFEKVNTILKMMGLHVSRTSLDVSINYFFVVKAVLESLFNIIKLSTFSTSASDKSLRHQDNFL